MQTYPKQPFLHAYSLRRKRVNTPQGSLIHRIGFFHITSGSYLGFIHLITHKARRKMVPFIIKARRAVTSVPLVWKMPWLLKGSLVLAVVFG